MSGGIRRVGDLTGRCGSLDACKLSSLRCEAQGRHVDAMKWVSICVSVLLLWKRWNIRNAWRLVTREIRAIAAGVRVR